MPAGPHRRTSGAHQVPPTWSQRPVVRAVVERAQTEGRVTEGAVLFTGVGNAATLGLYGRLGFEVDVDRELAQL